MHKSFKILDWDSEFFGLKVAQIDKNIFSEENKEGLLNQMDRNGIKFAYYFSDGPFEKNENDLYDFVLVNRRVPIKKKLSGPVKVHENISSYDKDIPDEKLSDLAQRAGEWSRFKFDPNIDSEKVRELYKIWISNSIKEENSDILIYRDEGVITGFVSLSFNPPEGTTPLFAVSREAEGKGVSFALMRAADNFLYEKGCAYYTSATQADNRTAITVFKRHGFEISPVEYVYHLWRK